MTNMHIDAPIRRVAVTPELLEIARKIQTGALRKVPITNDMVGASVHVEGNLSLVRPQSSRPQLTAISHEPSIMAVFEAFPMIEMSLRDVADLVREDKSCGGLSDIALKESLAHLAKQGKVSTIIKDGAQFFVSV